MVRQGEIQAQQRSQNYEHPRRIEKELSVFSVRSKMALSGEDGPRVVRITALTKYLKGAPVGDIMPATEGIICGSVRMILFCK
jgi:hypothetical protein